MKSFIQAAAVFLSPLMLGGWVYGLARLGMYLWGWNPEFAAFCAIGLTFVQFSWLYVAIEAGLIGDEKDGPRP